MVTIQYNFSGKALRKFQSNYKAGSNQQSHFILTKLAYDHAGRITSVSKNIDNTGDKEIVSATYNELGQMQSRTLGGGLEVQNLQYNIRGWLTAINKSFVENAGNSSSYFGEVIMYDDAGSYAQLNGAIGAVKWKAGGDGVARNYNFSYDNVNRLIAAEFTQQNDGSSNWTKDLVDFSVDGISYDAGGNILSMRQKGLNAGTIATIDSLHYQYFPNSNQLQKVFDGISNTLPLGDFTDTTYTGDDYAYDANGNIVKDINRRMHLGSSADGAVYNYLNKPDSIVISAKNTVYYYYDASGRKLRKQVNDYTTGTLVSKNYLYINGFVYLNDTLQYVLHEEGRIRYRVDSSDFRYDYFLRDHLGNVRTVLTEEQRVDRYPAASMEEAGAGVEQQLYTQVSQTRKAINEISDYPTDNTTSPNNYVSRVMADDKKIGPGITLKVMAGDTINIKVSSWYKTNGQGLSNDLPILLADIVNSLSAGIVQFPGHEGSGSLLSDENGILSSNVNDFLSDQDNNSASGRPKAFLNWILFDEQFKMVASSSGSEQVPDEQDYNGAVHNHVVNGLPITKSGFLYVFVSNGSQSVPVYFDNLQVTHVRGPLLQEQSYYPFGLKMAGISSKAFGVLPSQYMFNGGVELEEETQLYNTFYRQYDPQLGRFSGVDILSEETAFLSVYNFALNNPVSFLDKRGDAADTPPTFGNVTDLFNYILNNGIESFSDEFTRYKVGKQGAIYKIGVGNDLSQNWAGQWGVNLWWSDVGPGGDIVRDGFILGLSWVSLDNFRVDWNLFAAMNAADKINSAFSGGFVSGSESVLRHLEHERYISNVNTNGTIDLAIRAKNVGVVGNKVIKAIGRAGFIGGVLDATFAINNAFQNPTAGNITKAVFKSVLAAVKVNPVVSIVTTIADITGITDFLFDW